jgi:hypothetical protein
MTFYPYPTRGGFLALGAAVLAGAVAILVINFLPLQQNLPDVFKVIMAVLVSLAVMSLAIYAAIIAFRLHYDLTRNGLVIQWGLTRRHIPLESILDIVPGHSLTNPPAFRGLNIGGLRLGWGRLTDYGWLRFHTTAALSDSLLVVTPEQTFVISPQQPDHFIKAWQARQSLGPTQRWSFSVRRSWPFSYSLLSDPLTWWLLGLSSLACLALFGYLALNYPTLPRSLPIHFNAFGLPDRIADKSSLFNLPLLGLAVLGVNTILGGLFYRWERVAAYLLWGSTLAVQICLWVAAVTLT